MTCRCLQVPGPEKGVAGPSACEDPGGLGVYTCHDSGLFLFLDLHLVYNFNPNPDFNPKLTRILKQLLTLILP
jgi:hypothetical protein